MRQQRLGDLVQHLTADQEAAGSAASGPATANATRTPTTAEFAAGPAGPARWRRR
ncbi:MAG: hypothetical protein M3332_18645 [Actinomycetota bacterium]|nr:hypothetical protein [Actinomycetota bacterium]